MGDGGQGWESALELREKRNFPLFTGLVSLIDTNIFIAMQYFFDYSGTHIDFRRQLANVLLNNPLRVEADDANFNGLDGNEHKHHVQGWAKKRGKCVICSRVRGLKQNEIPQSTLYCETCGPMKLCRDSPERNCWTYHILHGIPPRTKTPYEAP